MLPPFRTKRCTIASSFLAGERFCVLRRKLEAEKNLASDSLLTRF